MPATITATILGLAAQIEREFISARTKEALERRKAAGLPVVDRKAEPRSWLDDEIVDYLNKGVAKLRGKDSRLFTHHTLLLDPAQTHFRKMRSTRLSVAGFGDQR